MKDACLEVTCRYGKALAAYYYLPRRTRDKGYRTSQPAASLVVDYTRAGQPRGIEITAPLRVSLTTPNRVLRDLGFSPVTRAGLAPLRGA
jgi:hypothetical protein